jgi:thimet oligopeptidase
MLRPRLLAPFALALALAAVACDEPPPATPAQPTAAPVAELPPSPASTEIAPFDPVGDGETAEGIKRVCDQHLAAAQAIVDRIKKLNGAPADKLTYEATLGAFDDVLFEVENASQFPYLIALVHPDDAVREAAKLCEPAADKFNTNLLLDADVAAVLRAYAAKKEPLAGEKKRLLSDTLRDYRTHGLELAPDKQATLRAMNDEITKIGQQFESNIGAKTDSIKVKPAQLAGLPPDYVAKHPKGADGLVTITTDYPDYFPFATYAKDRKAALELYVLFTNRGGDANVKLLGELLKLRSDKAKLLGYATWADLAIEPRMAKSSKVVKDFLEGVAAKLKAQGAVEYAELMKEHVALGGKKTDKLTPVDRYYLSDLVRAKKYAFDSKELKPYFEIGAVKKGLLAITSQMYGVTYAKVDAPVWHPDVDAYDVIDHGRKIGRFYLDLYPRDKKYKHAAMYPIVSGKRLADGTYEMPVAALACNFPKPGAEPALMTHEEVTTFFHEFGHVLHHLLTTSELARYSGTSTVQDFVEAPSQMFEEWAWDKSVLDLFAKHVKTGAKIPDKLYAAMTRARGFGRALDTERQLFLALLDLEYHSRQPPFDTTKVVEEVQARVDDFAFVPGTHFQSSFGHLIGYDAGYYSYQWALSISRDVLTRFKKEGLLNPATAKAWRDEVLSKGGGIDEREMLTHFLGRAPSDAAYVQYLTGAAE